MIPMETRHALDRLAQVQGVTGSSIGNAADAGVVSRSKQSRVVRRLEPLNVEAQLGASYRLKRATVEVTKDVPAGDDYEGVAVACRSKIR